MGEYADDYFRQEVKDQFGFDPGSTQSDRHKPRTTKVHCKICGKRVNPSGLNDHARDAHSTKPQQTQEGGKNG